MIERIAPSFLPCATHCRADGAKRPAAFAIARTGSQRGFISFILAAAFLFALIPAAMLVSGSQPDISYENFRASLAREVAIKQAFYGSSAQAISRACIAEKETQLASLSSGGSYLASEEKIKGAALDNAQAFEASLWQQGYDIVFWCGVYDDNSRKASSGRMFASKRAIAPEFASPLDSCKGSFEVNLKTGKFSLRSFGFSIYDRRQGIGKAAVFPDSYEVGFTC